MFSDRLDYIMKLTGTKASDLGLATNLNASYISRLKNGSRPLPKTPDFLPAMSVYLMRRACLDYQRDNLCHRLGLSSWPTTEQEAATYIEKWLTGTESDTSGMTHFLNSFSNKTQTAHAGSSDGELPPVRQYYFGEQGKQEAVLQFFRLVMLEKTSQTLLLSSEEDMGWLYEDPTFAQRWAQDFMRVLGKGNHVKIIHHVGRDLNEMLEAVTKWVPVYMTGLIEPYYYPKLRDGIFRRTLFLAPKTAAIVSMSVGRNVEGMLNELITDPDAIDALVREYMNFFSLCQPLMTIFLENDVDELQKALDTLLQANGSLVCAAGEEALTTLDTPAKPPAHDTIPALLTRFLSNIVDCTPILASDLPPNLFICCRENVGVIMAKTDSPCVAFAISDLNMTSAFWSHFSTRV